VLRSKRRWTNRREVVEQSIGYFKWYKRLLRIVRGLSRSDASAVDRVRLKLRNELVCERAGKLYPINVWKHRHIYRLASAAGTLAFSGAVYVTNLLKGCGRTGAASAGCSDAERFVADAV
jgi:hypothetical protein